LPRVEPAPLPAPPRKRTGLRVIAAIGAVVLVLVAAGGLARLWVMQQYFVGVDGTQVTIFQGVRGAVLGVPLHDAVEHTDITVDQLTQTDRNAVEDGIMAPNGIDDAHSVVQRLSERKLKPCPVTSATAVPTPAPAPPPAPGQPPAPTTTTTPLPQATAIPGVTCWKG
jgi:protein phosphatase